jgi:6-pyruvoyltetrahydropterin/6-carboxytetrahydropterin synthase
MVIDFGDVADVWNNELQPLLDHRNLNDTIDIAPTTAELIARWAYARLRGTLGGVVERVRVYETSNSWAEFPA